MQQQSKAPVKMIILILLISNSAIAGYGDYLDGRPLRSEREVLVMTNAVRMDPAGFRDKYIPSTSILLPANYPAVGPLWYNVNLSKSSQSHSTEMAATCGLVHNSCDGTTFDKRINSYDYKSSALAENIATGYATGIQTVIQWLRDDDAQKVPAADKSGYDGHRANIMSSTYHEIGIGYSYSSSRQWYYFWTEDFGANTGAGYKIPGGCHFATPGSSTALSFAANYYDKSGAAPLSAIVVIDNVQFQMSLYLGKASAGTYSYSMTKDNQSHCYYFIFKDGSGAIIRYPETTTLSTVSDSGCTNAHAGKLSRNNLLSKNSRSDDVLLYEVNGRQLKSISEIHCRTYEGILIYKSKKQNGISGLKKIFID